MIKNKYIALVDGNNFFASCEQMINPDLRGKAVCVLSNNDGCVIARSQEAKNMGIPMGIPYFMARKTFNNAIYLSSNFALYQDISSRMMKILHNYTDIVDVYSIDEAFLDLSGIDKIFKMSYRDIILKIRNDIDDQLGIKVSVGLASTKILAKLANHKAKKSIGIYFIQSHLVYEEIENIPIEEIWGIGRNIARTLKRYGIFYAHEILLKDDNFYRHILGKKGMELKYELQGISVIPFEVQDEKPKSIQKTRAFPEFSKDKNYIKTELNIHLHNVCKKLRQNNLEANYISLMLRTKDFRVFYKDIKIENASNSEFILMPYIEKLFEKLFIEGIVYRSSGIYVYGLSSDKKGQLSLFEKKANKKSERISLLLDRIEDKYGKGLISIGDGGIKNIANKHVRKNSLNPFD